MILNFDELSHSRDKLELVSIDNKSFIKKTFCGDIDRAIKNISKQQLFNDMNLGVTKISAAKISSIQMLDGAVELVMPYVAGITGYAIPSYATAHSGRILQTAISSLLKDELTKAELFRIDIGFFLEKIFSISENIFDLELLHSCNQVIEILQDFPRSMLFPVGPCHGDLTLSNLIITAEDEVILIDFLDTYLESPLQDIAKLKQDLIYGWSFRYLSEPMRLKADIFMSAFLKNILFELEEVYPLQIKLLEVLTLLRIAPYVNDVITKAWFFSSISKCIKGLKK